MKGKVSIGIKGLEVLQKASIDSPLLTKSSYSFMVVVLSIVVSLVCALTLIFTSLRLNANCRSLVYRFDLYFQSPCFSATFLQNRILLIAMQEFEML